MYYQPPRALGLLVGSGLALWSAGVAYVMFAFALEAGVGIAALLAYTGSAADGADISLDRTREGYVEIIEMGDLRRTSDTETACSSRPADTIESAEMTACVRPDNVRNITAASMASTGLPKIRPSSTTSVSAPRTTASGCPITRSRPAPAFSRATRRT